MNHWRRRRAGLGYGLLAATPLLLGSLVSGAASARAVAPAEGATLAGHAVVLDREGMLLSWAQPQEAAYGRVVRLAWEQLLTGFPVEENGLPTWLAYCCFDGETLRGGAWPHRLSQEAFLSHSTHVSIV